MSWITFGTAVSPEPASQLDAQFTNVASGMTLPCSAAGTNAISLTPLASFPALSSYNELGGYRFTAQANTTAPVTAQYNGLGFLPVYKADGVTQASTGDLLLNEQYILTFHQALNSGIGGFFLESPSVGLSASGNWFTPGGRLSLINNNPVMFANATGIQNIFYVPYNHQWVPNYNGSIVQMVQFATPISSQTGLTLALGGAANFPSGANFDVFFFLSGGVTPALCAIQWTNTTTRATTLSTLGGFLTNSGSATAQTGVNTSTTLAINQGTFLGTFNCSAQGTTQWVFGASASGGTAGSFLLSNYYNKVPFVSQTTDSGTSYTYSSATIRQARASSGNQCTVLQSDSERALLAVYGTVTTPTGAAGAETRAGIGFNSTTTFLAPGGTVTHLIATGSILSTPYATAQFTSTGLFTVTANEQSDGTNSNVFNNLSTAVLTVTAWL